MSGIITLEEVKQYARIEIDEDDALLRELITAAEAYLRNATDKDYPPTDEYGNPAKYALEKVYLQLLVTYWYEQRSPVGRVGEDFNRMTRSIMLQLRYS